MLTHPCSEAWVPYKASDLQLEFVMLDAYVRKGMTHDNNGTFTCQFKVRGPVEEWSCLTPWWSCSVFC